MESQIHLQSEEPWHGV